MGKNKIIYCGETLIDLTKDTVTPETLAKGATAHNASGEQIIGIMESGTSDTTETLTFTVINGSTVDLSEVSEIIIPEGLVTKITNNVGTVLWEMMDNWTAADYIRFTGEQVVDTGIVPNYNTRIEVTFTRESSENKYLYGVRNSANTASVTAYLGSNTAWRFGNTLKNYAISTNKTYTAIVDKSGISMNGVKSSYNGTVATFIANATLTIGSARSAEGALTDPQFVGTVSEFRMYNNDELVLELLPVYNTTKNIYAFYDTVSGKLKPSMTETPFEGG